MTGQALIVQGDALRLPLPDRSVDAIVTDPPYGLGFMGHQWDQPGKYAATSSAHGYGKFAFKGEKHPAMEAGRYDVSRTGNARFQAWCQEWATEALRVLKPGGWLLAFGGTRTWHRLACGIEDAGFEMRDTIAEFSPSYGPLAWVTGQGFPKGKACLKPAWEPVIVARRPGSSVLQIDASRIRTSDDLNGGTYSGQDNRETSPGWRMANASRPFVQPSGRWPPNVALIHSEGCQPTGTRKIRTGLASPQSGGIGGGMFGDGEPDNIGGGYADADGMEEVTAWTCQPDCPVALLDQQSGERRSAGLYPTTYSNSGGYGGQMGLDVQGPLYVDQGGASRFMATFQDNDEGIECFKRPRCVHPVSEDGKGSDPRNTGAAARSESRFLYTAKAGPNERVTIDGEGHPTVKPLALMRWLVRLVTPPGGLVLDMFAGSGTTGEAAMLEGFRCVLIDKDPSNLPSIRVRTHPYVRRTRVVTNGQAGPEQGSLL